MSNTPRKSGNRRLIISNAPSSSNSASSANSLSQMLHSQVGSRVQSNALAVQTLPNPSTALLPFTPTTQRLSQLPTFTQRALIEDGNMKDMTRQQRDQIAGQAPQIIATIVGTQSNPGAMKNTQKIMNGTAHLQEVFVKAIKEGVVTVRGSGEVTTSENIKDVIVEQDDLMSLDPVLRADGERLEVITTSVSRMKGLTQCAQFLLPWAFCNLLGPNAMTLLPRLTSMTRNMILGVIDAISVMIAVRDKEVSGSRPEEPVLEGVKSLHTRMHAKTDEELRHYSPNRKDNRLTAFICTRSLSSYIMPGTNKPNPNGGINVKGEFIPADKSIEKDHTDVFINNIGGLIGRNGGNVIKPDIYVTIVRPESINSLLAAYVEKKLKPNAQVSQEDITNLCSFLKQCDAPFIARDHIMHAWAYMHLRWNEYYSKIFYNGDDLAQFKNNMLDELYNTMGLEFSTFLKPKLAVPVLFNAYIYQIWHNIVTTHRKVAANEPKIDYDFIPSECKDLGLCFFFGMINVETFITQQRNFAAQVSQAVNVPANDPLVTALLDLFTTDEGIRGMIQYLYPKDVRFCVYSVLHPIYRSVGMPQIRLDTDRIWEEYKKETSTKFKEMVLKKIKLLGSSYDHRIDFERVEKATNVIWERGNVIWDTIEMDEQVEDKEGYLIDHQQQIIWMDPRRFLTEADVSSKKQDFNGICLLDERIQSDLLLGINMVFCVRSFRKTAYECKMMSPCTLVDKNVINELTAHCLINLTNADADTFKMCSGMELNVFVFDDSRTQTGNKSISSRIEGILTNEVLFMSPNSIIDNTIAVVVVETHRGFLFCRLNVLRDHGKHSLTVLYISTQSPEMTIMTTMEGGYATCLNQRTAPITKVPGILKQAIERYVGGKVRLIEGPSDVIYISDGEPVTEQNRRRKQRCIESGRSIEMRTLVVEDIFEETDFDSLKSRLSNFKYLSNHYSEISTIKFNALNNEKPNIPCSKEALALYILHVVFLSRESPNGPLRLPIARLFQTFSSRKMPNIKTTDQECVPFLVFACYAIAMTLYYMYKYPHFKKEECTQKLVIVNGSTNLELDFVKVYKPKNLSTKLARMMNQVMKFYVGIELFTTAKPEGVDLLNFETLLGNMGITLPIERENLSWDQVIIKKWLNDRIKCPVGFELGNKCEQGIFKLMEVWVKSLSGQ